ncbi:hypothetical protein QBC46DRAFT_412956 [Diplogelasinospora grovesii]|uniref:Uncharacterized protein n=1 Tax=Diplogelasinospora grovesii TaxID=303347 RepID=A0AAN6MXV3_9PEZI|nr:hypothetical protein QBC46DRAFT_412956 [Diplogelasinospora grovesii]
MCTGRTDFDYFNGLASRVTHETDFNNGRGDINLIIKYDHFEESEFQSFLASSAAMIRSYGNVCWLVRSGRDNHVIRKILMNIIHLRFGDVPQTLGLRTLAELAILTVKYMLTTLIAPWLKGWLGPLYPTIKESGNEYCWLWISWEFGLTDIFNHVSHKLCIETSLTRAPLEESRVSSPEDHMCLSMGEHCGENRACKRSWQ